jgi:hypothetical protein
LDTGCLRQKVPERLKIEVAVVDVVGKLVFEENGDIVDVEP